jgi:hypothetical protein
MPSVQRGSVDKVGSKWRARWYDESDTRRSQEGSTLGLRLEHLLTARWTRSLRFGGATRPPYVAVRCQPSANSWTSTSASTTPRRTRSAP